MSQVFDLSDQNITCSRRNASTVATQSCTLLNDDFVLRQAQLSATRVAEATPNDLRTQIRMAYEIGLSRSPTSEEMRLALEFLGRQKLADLTHVLFNLNEFVSIRWKNHSRGNHELLLFTP